jgi:transcriptional regulator of arginine metabolism
MDKLRRQAALMRLVRSRPLGNQKQIVALMQREGFRVTQASVSRDIRDLGLVKLAGRYVSAEQALSDTADNARTELELGWITGLEPVGANLVIIKTRVGAANPVALVLDREMSENIAGTIAGDDTVFVAVRSRSDQGRVVARLNAWLRHAPPADSAAFPDGATQGRIEKQKEAKA